MSSSLPARRGRGGGARATEGRRAAETSEHQASQQADRAARREERSAATRRTSGSERGDAPAGPMGREVQQAPGAGPQVRASELGGRSVASAASEPGSGSSARRSPARGDDRAGRGRAERTRAALRSPAALCQAILVREVLGPPAAFQTGHRDVPGLPRP